MGAEEQNEQPWDLVRARGKSEDTGIARASPCPVLKLCQQALNFQSKKRRKSCKGKITT